MKQKYSESAGMANRYSDLLRDAKRLAGSVLSQDEHKGPRPDPEPQAGTSAYEMVAAIEEMNVGVTETLINMVIATVLATLIDEEGGGRTNVAISPQAMSQMLDRYEMDAKRDGLLSVVNITPRPGVFGDAPLPPLEAHLEAKPESLMTQDEEETAFEPQAEAHEYDRPLWGARVDGKLFPTSGREQAETVVRNADTGQIATIENRYCYHPDCPAERCNHLTNQTALTK